MKVSKEPKIVKETRPSNGRKITQFVALNEKLRKKKNRKENDFKESKKRRIVEETKPSNVRKISKENDWTESEERRIVEEKKSSFIERKIRKKVA